MDIYTLNETTLTYKNIVNVRNAESSIKESYVIKNVCYNIDSFDEKPSYVELGHEIDPIFVIYNNFRYIDKNFSNSKDFIIKILKHPNNGVLNISKGNIFRYTPNLRFKGKDTVIFDILSNDKEFIVHISFAVYPYASEAEFSSCAEKLKMNNAIILKIKKS